MKLEGVGPDAPTETLANGAKQSRIPYRFDAIDAKAMLALAEVAGNGDRKYGPDNWRGIGTRDHINHAIMHLYAYLAGDNSDAHLSHAACRTMMALAMDLSHWEEHHDPVKHVDSH